MPPEDTIVVIGADWDDCFASFELKHPSPNSLRESVTDRDAKKMVDHMRNVLLHPIQTSQQPSQRDGQPHLLSFSTRAGFWGSELYNVARNGTIMCDDEQGLPEIARKFGLIMHKHQLADTLGQLRSGTTHDLLALSYEKRSEMMSETLKQQTREFDADRQEQLDVQLCWQWNNTIQQNNKVNPDNTINPATDPFNDPHKGLLLLNTAFFAATIQQAHGTKRVHLHIVDDRGNDILKSLQRMVMMRPDMLSKRLTVAFHQLHRSFCDEAASAKQIGQVICGTGDHLADPHFNHEDLIRRMAKLAKSTLAELGELVGFAKLSKHVDLAELAMLANMVELAERTELSQHVNLAEHTELSKHVNTETWVLENQGDIFCLIYDEALKQLKEESLKESLKRVDALIKKMQTLFITPGTSLSRNGTGTSAERDNSNQGSNNIIDIDASLNLRRCDNQIPASTKRPFSTRIEVQEKEELIRGNTITYCGSPQSCSETLFFDSREQPPILRWTEDDVVKRYPMNHTQ